MSEAGPLIPNDLLLLAQQAGTPLQQMTAQQRQAVFAALAIIVVLGIVMILLVSISARMMRRYVRQPPVRSTSASLIERGDDWAKKPMIEVDAGSDVDDAGEDES